MRIFGASSGTDGSSTHCPVRSNFQPWYEQRMPHSSFRPKYSDAPRCAQNSSISPGRPALSRNASSRSPRILTRTCAPSGSSISLDDRIGTQ
jgi:hypothetical protein